MNALASRRPWRRRPLVRCGICVGAALWLIQAHAEAPPDPAARAEARAAMEAIVAGPVYSPGTPDQAAVLAVIGERLEPAFERFDRALLESALAPAFERRLLIADDAVLVEGRVDFLAARAAWQASGEPRRDLVYAVQQMHASGDAIEVIALSTWKSRYFSPRFVETLSFVRAGDGWQLRAQVLAPLHPAKREMHAVTIVGAGGDGGAGAFIEDFNASAVGEGPDAAIERLPPLERTGGSSGTVTAVAAFAEPPPVGAKIELDFHFRGGNCNVYRSSRTEVESVTPYAVFSAAGEWSGCSEIQVNVYLDGVLLARETLAL